MRFYSIFHEIRAIVEKRPLWTTKSNASSRPRPQNLSKKTTASQTNFGLGPRSLAHLFHGEKAIWNKKKANVSHCRSIYCHFYGSLETTNIHFENGNRFQDPFQFALAIKLAHPRKKTLPIEKTSLSFTTSHLQTQAVSEPNLGG